MAKKSPHWGGSGISTYSKKTDWSSVLPDAVSEERVKLLNDYVKWDDGPDGRELCWIVHEEGEVCHKVEGHD